MCRSFLQVDTHMDTLRVYWLLLRCPPSLADSSGVLFRCQSEAGPVLHVSQGKGGRRMGLESQCGALGLILEWLCPGWPMEQGSELWALRWWRLEVTLVPSLPFSPLSYGVLLLSRWML